jgi:hypothetical protein
LRGSVNVHFRDVASVRAMMPTHRRRLICQE